MLLMDEMEYFPRARYDDLTDSATQAVWWFRQAGYLQRREEREAVEEAALRIPPRPAPPLYPV